MKQKVFNAISNAVLFFNVFWLMDIKGMDIFSRVNNPFATKPKELVAKLATTEKNLECCLSINRRSKLHAVIDCLFLILTMIYVGHH